MAFAGSRGDGRAWFLRAQGSPRHGWSVPDACFFWGGVGGTPKSQDHGTVSAVRALATCGTPLSPAPCQLVLPDSCEPSWVHKTTTAELSLGRRGPRLTSRRSLHECAEVV